MTPEQNRRQFLMRSCGGLGALAVSAMMQGRLRIEGDMANAMQLQGVIEKLQSD